MLCQKCGLSAATVHRESVVFRQRIEEHLCQLCAGTGAEILLSRLGEVTGPTGEPVREPVKAGPKSKTLGVVTGLSSNRKAVPHGLGAIPELVRTLRASKLDGPSACIYAESPGNPAFLTLHRQEPGWQLKVMLTPHNPPGQNAAVRQFFSKRNGPDPLARQGSPTSGIGHLLFELAVADETVATLVMDLLRECYGVGPADLLEFLLNRA